jgi:hypothetical protein
MTKILETKKHLFLWLNAYVLHYYMAVYIFLRQCRMKIVYRTWQNRDAEPHISVSNAQFIFRRCPVWILIWHWAILTDLCTFKSVLSEEYHKLGNNGFPPHPFQLNIIQSFDATYSELMRVTDRWTICNQINTRHRTDKSCPLFKVLTLHWPHTPAENDQNVQSHHLASRQDINFVPLKFRSEALTLQ